MSHGNGLATKPSGRPALIVQPGVHVDVVYEDGQVVRAVIGRERSSNARLGIVGIDAPLGRAICGAREGERRSFMAGRLERVVHISLIRPATS